MSGEKFRWHATAVYRTQNGPLEVEHDLIEMSDLDNLIELGPHWDAIISIVIKRVNHVDSESLTIEQAQEL